jgi:hypothetical protein
MGVGVVGDLVAFGHDSPGEIGMQLNLPAHNKECGLGAMLPEQFQDGWRAGRVRPVVDREPDLTLLCFKGCCGRAKGLVGGEDELKYDPWVGQQEHDDCRQRVVPKGED